MQLVNAQQKNKIDSAQFYRYEMDYMETEIDSITKGILQSDTTHRYGTVIGSAYYLKKNNKTKIDSTVFFIDSAAIIRFNDFQDSAIHRSIKTLD